MKNFLLLVGLSVLLGASRLSAAWQVAPPASATQNDTINVYAYGNAISGNFSTVMVIWWQTPSGTWANQPIGGGYNGGSMSGNKSFTLSQPGTWTFVVTRHANSPPPSGGAPSGEAITSTNTTSVTALTQPVSFSFGDLDQYYDGNMKTASVSPSPGHATYTADLTKGPGIGSYTVTATGTGAFSGSGSATLNILNRPPTVAWSNLPAGNSAYVNQWFNVQARGDDPDGNLSFVFVWRDGQPFAFNGWPNGFTRYSDNNAAMSSTPGTISFMAKSGDTSGAESGYIYSTVTIVNRAPTITMSASPTTINFGQSANLTSVATDADGNLAFHGILVLNPAGNDWFRAAGTDHSTGWGNHPTTNDFTAINYTSGVTSGSTSTRTATHRPAYAGSFTYHNNTHDNYLWASDGNWAQCVGYAYVTVNKAAPNQAGWFNRTWTGTGAAPAGSFAVTLSNPYSTAVAQPTGTPSFSVVSATGTGAFPTNGTVVNASTAFYPGDYTVRCSYPGDANYLPASWDVTFSVVNVAPTAAMSIKGLTSGTTTGTITETLTITASGADADANLRAVNLWVQTPSIPWRNILSNNTLNAGGIENFTTDNAVNSPTNVATLGPVNRTFSIVLDGGTGTYQYVVRSMDARGVASASQQVNVTVSKAAQAALTLNAGTPLGYRLAETISATGGSGTGAVTYAIVGSSAAGVATLSGTTLTANVGSGWVDVQATKAADNNYNAITSAIVRVNLAKAPLTITANSIWRYYSMDNPTSYGVDYAGFRGSDTPGVVLGLSVNTTATPASPAGNYPITPSGATADNYAITFVAGNFEIRRMPVVFAFTDTAPIYDNAVHQPGVLWRIAPNDVPQGAFVTPPAGSWAPKNPQPAPPGDRLTKISEKNKPDAPYIGYAFTVEALGNYTGTRECLWTIVCCTANIDFGNSEFVYDGTPKAVTAVSSSPSGLVVNIHYDNGDVPPTLAGTYHVTAEIADGVWGGTKAVDMHILPATQAQLTLPTTASLTYSQTLTVAVPSSGPGSGSGNGVVTYAVVGQSPDAVFSFSNGQLTANSSVGYVDIRATKATGTDGKAGLVGNYNSATSNVMRVNFGKADQADVTLAAATPQAYLSSQTLQAAGGTVGAFSYAITGQSAAGVATLSGPTNNILTANVSSGWVEVTATRAGDSYYNPKSSAPFRVYFKKATATVTLAGLNQTYDGTPRVVTATTNPAGRPVVITYTTGSNPPTLTAPVSVGDHIVLATIDDPNYEGWASDFLTVIRATPVVTWATPAPITYGVLLGAAQLNATASVPGMFFYNPDAGPLYTPGTYLLTVLFNATDVVNYTQNTPKDVSLAVVKATPVGSFTGNTWSLNHPLSAQDLSATFAHPFSSALGLQQPTGTITYEVVNSSGTYRSPASGPVTIGTTLLPGTYTIQAHYSGDSNYNSANVTADFTVTLEPTGDADSDGIPNKWEEDHGLNPGVSGDALLDPDGDGLTNVAEYNLGKEPMTYDSGTSNLGNTIPEGWPNAGGGANHSANLAVGATAGELAVDKSGAATYSVPIWTTPGTSGMQPQVTLNYSSQGGAGIAGFGWSLGGVSAITRGPKTIAVDGVASGVQFTNDDPLYLDGQRLIQLADGTYRTELETFTRVTKVNSRAFKAQTKAGLTIWFGNENGSTGGAAFEAFTRAEPFSWHVSKIVDTTGNYMTFIYEGTVNATEGSHRLARINYTGNGTDKQPYASLRFEYEDRPDAVRGYSGGSPVTSTKRLKAIRSYYGEDIARTYTFNYTQRAYTNRSMLSSLTETGSDNQSYPPLNFTYGSPSDTLGWDTTAPNFAYTPPYPLADNRPGRTFGTGTGFVDLNGDGRVDFVARRDFNTGTSEVQTFALNNGTGWDTAPSGYSYNLPHPLGYVSRGDDTGARFVDFDNDGLVDLVVYKVDANGTDQAVASWRNTGSGWSSVYDDYLLPAPAARDSSSTDYSKRGGRFMDVNGDGRPDYVTFLTKNPGVNGGRTKIAVYLNNGTGWDRAPSAAYSEFGLPGGSPPDLPDKQVRFVDLNGDGLPDILVSFKNGSTYDKYVALNTGTSWAGTGSNWTPPTWIAESGQPRIGAELMDINADGLPDLIWSRETPTIESGYALNTGNGWDISQSVGAFLSPAELGRQNSPGSGVAFVDANADGQVDLLMARYLSGAGAQSTHLGTGAVWQPAPDSLKLPENLLVNNWIVGADFVDFDGDGASDFVWKRWAAAIGIVVQSGVARNLASPLADRLTTVTNGMGVAATITYRTLLDPAVYTKGGTGEIAAPVGSVDIAGAMYVVSTVTHDDGIGGVGGFGGQYSINYRYQGLRAERLRGSLGFARMVVTDTRTSTRSETFFRQDFPFIGMPKRSLTIVNVGASEVTLKETLVDYGEKLLNSNKTHFIFARDSDETSTDLNGSPFGYVSTSIPAPATDNIDDHGNVKKLVVDTGGFTKETISQYNFDNEANWFLGRMSSSTVTSSAPNGYGDPISRSSSFTYDPTTGLLAAETVEGGDDTKLTTTYGYDRFGNKTSTEVKGKSLTVDDDGNYQVGSDITRTNTTHYSDSNGRFPEWTRNALSQQENGPVQQETYSGYNPALGVLMQLTGANGLVTNWAYDGFGRKIQETRADNTVTTTHYRWVEAAPSLAQYYGAAPVTKYLVETETTGAPPSLAFYDAFGRAFLGLSVNGDGRIVYTTTQFDSLGRTIAASVPYFGGAIAYWTHTDSFDAVSRPLIVKTPDDGYGGDAAIFYSYSGFEASVIDPKGRTSRTTVNAAGWTLSNTRNATAATTAADYSNVSYGYDVLGNLTSTAVAATTGNVTTSLGYDARGRKKWMTDADMGYWEYRYNVFGDLIWQKDAKGQIVRMSYDAFGRLTARTEPEGTTTWTYDTSPTKGTGKLHIVAVTGSGGNYTETYLYDALGRPASLKRRIDGIDYLTQTTYDALGRPLRTIYPEVSSGNAISTRNVYNDFGYLKEIRNWLTDDDTRDRSHLQGRIYWMADSYTVTGKINGETYGNGLANDRVYSAITGRLLRATVDRGIVTEYPFSVQDLNYAYDVMGNVKTRNEYAANFVREESFFGTDLSDGYDGLDRLKIHRVVGGATVTVAYDQRGNILSKSDVGTYFYSGYGPHAVSGVSGGPLGVKNYIYDLVGNMTSGAGRTFEWTSFNQMKKVTQGSFSSEFSFGSGRERVMQVKRTGASVTERTIYVGALYEKVITGAGTEHKHYIMGPTGRVAVYTERTNFSKDTRWLHTDGLGSITVVTDESGHVLKRYTYDAWGKQGTAYTNTTGAGITNTAPTTRGFTDHEMLNDFGLIHMNGRVYDPTLGRFISADPNVDGVSDAQGYNRYSYVGNNPANATDPSGYFKLKEILPAIIAIVVTAVAIITQQYWALGYTGSLWGAFTTGLTTFSSVVVGGAAGGFASGFSGSLLNGGSLGDAFKAGAIGAAWGAAGAAVAFGVGQLFDRMRDLGLNSSLEWGGRAFVHGAAQGGFAEAQGGAFRHGFYAAAFSSAASPAIHGVWGDKLDWHVAARTITAAVVGGTASGLGGGKFANGALTAAFTHLFNDEVANAGLIKAAGRNVMTHSCMECHGLSWRERSRIGLPMEQVWFNEDGTFWAMNDMLLAGELMSVVLMPLAFEELAVAPGNSRSSMDGYRLRQQLVRQEAESAFDAAGAPSAGAIARSRQIIPSGSLTNPKIPKGFAKYSTETFQSPSGDFQVHFYMNPNTGQLFLNFDYKTIFNLAPAKK